MTTPDASHQGLLSSIRDRLAIEDADRSAWLDRYLRKGGWRDRAPEPRPQAASCLCGACPKCKKREAMRRWRSRKYGAKPGRRSDLGRVCRDCKRGIADANDSGRCSRCYRNEWRRQSRKGNG